MATEGQKTIERMTAGLTDYQCRAFAALVRDVRDGEPDEVVGMRVQQCRLVTGNVQELGNLDERAPEPDAPADPDAQMRDGFRAKLETLKFDELRAMAEKGGLDLKGLDSKDKLRAALLAAYDSAE